ncbi:MAG TPA: hypothetical protein VJY33_15870, partial [Isosphaeraceae bacterium]|nr:hypothetical protein [Isosphaeraceae bacterium]
MTEELEQLLRSLHLKRILEIYDDHLKTSEKNDVTYTDFLLGLLRPQWHARQEQSLEWRIKRSGLPEP